jgi:hypothetical protein
MALSKGINSYVDLPEAEAYFEDRLDAAAWTDGSEAQKLQSLVTATAILDLREWTGIAVSDSQPLAFPRKGSYFDPRIGKTVCLPADIPVRVANATYELAYHLLNNDGLLDDTGGVTDLQLGTITLKEIKAPTTLPAHVYRTIRPMLCNSGTNLWWRAN